MSLRASRRGNPIKNTKKIASQSLAMTRKTNDKKKMETYFTYENLYKAYLDCRKRKSMSFYAMEFSQNLEENLLTLEKQLQTRTYKPGRSIAFIVEKPKIREIFAADFRDRVVHHLLHNYLSPIFEKVFIYDSWACRKGKGTHGAMLRLREFVHKLDRSCHSELVEESPMNMGTGIRQRSFGCNLRMTAELERERERESYDTPKLLPQNGY